MKKLLFLIFTICMHSGFIATSDANFQNKETHSNVKNLLEKIKNLKQENTSYDNQILALQKEIDAHEKALSEKGLYLDSVKSVSCQTEKDK